MTVWKKLSYLLLTLILIFSLLCTVSHRGAELGRRDDYSLDAIDGSRAFGYLVEENGENIRFTPTQENPYLPFNGGGREIRFLVLEFAEPIDDAYPKISATQTDEMSEDVAWYSGLRSTDSRRVIFALRADMPTEHLWLRIADTCTLRAIYTADYVGEPSLGFNPMALVLFAVVLAVLLLTERKFGYFAYLKSLLAALVDTVKASRRDGKTWLFVLQLLTWTVTLLYLVGLGILFLLGAYTKATLLAVFVGTLATLILQLAMRILSGKGASVAKLFLICVLLVGIMFCFTMPPTLYVCWDDDAHFDNAFELVHLFSDEAKLSEKLIYTHGLYPIADYQADPSALIDRLVSGESTDVLLNPTFCNPYQALAYLPMMLGVGLTAIAGADVVQMLLLSRLFTLLTYALVIYFGIRRLKSGAYLAATIAMIPTAIFLACSINYDYWMTAWMIFGFAYLISLLQRPERKIGGKEIAAMLVAFFLAFGPKAIYTFLLLPILFLKKDRFTSPKTAKKCRRWTLAVIAFVLATLVVPAFVAPNLYTDTRGGSDVSAGGQIAFILSNPFQYARILLRFLSEYTSFVSLGTSGMLFAYLGYAPIFYGTVISFVLLYTIFTDRSEDDAYGTMQGMRWVTLLTVFVQIVLIVTSLYVGYTPVGHETINGCQYRYIFPLLFPFCFFLAPKGLRASVNPRLQSLFVFGSMALAAMFSYYQGYLAWF